VPGARCPVGVVDPVLMQWRTERRGLSIKPPAHEPFPSCAAPVLGMVENEDSRHDLVGAAWAVAQPGWNHPDFEGGDFLHARGPHQPTGGGERHTLTRRRSEFVGPHRHSAVVAGRVTPFSGNGRGPCPRFQGQSPLSGTACVSEAASAWRQRVLATSRIPCLGLFPPGAPVRALRGIRPGVPCLLCLTRYGRTGEGQQSTSARFYPIHDFCHLRSAHQDFLERTPDSS
jgi:hypothetical protein